MNWLKDRRRLYILGLFLLSLMVGVFLAACTGSEGQQGPPGIQGIQGIQGEPGPLPPGVERQLNASIAISNPTNGTHFVAGEQPLITVTLKDQFDRAFSRAEDFSQLRFQVYGPQETTETVTAVKLINASADRSQSVHHYIDLKTNPDVQVSGDTLTYRLQPVSDEEAGTYIASLWAVLKATPLQQAMPLAEFQIGTATVETQIVDKEKCASCHLGAASGKFYFAHVDPRERGQSGYFSLDSVPVKTCKSCHNNEGYSAYRDPNNPDVRIVDQIVKRVHGVHMGEGLENPLNIDPETGVFKEYTSVVFPADVRNCTACHVDDRYKTEPSRLACGACHDNIWFGDAASMPATAESHPGGPQANDTSCALCHTSGDTGLSPIPVVHKIEWPFKNTVELAMTPPANGEYFVAGEAPQVTITLKDAATGAVINPASIVEPKDRTKPAVDEWTRGNLFVSGPRSETVPVLTTEAAHPNPALFYAENDLRVRIDSKNEDPKATRSATAITYQLDDVAGLKAGTYTVLFEVKPATGLGGWAVMNFQIGTDKEEPKVATNCTDCHKDNRQHPEFFAVQYNTDICKSCHDYERQGTGVGWNFPGGWNGFGAQPIVRKVHTLHFGHYVNNPEDVVFPVLRKPANPNGFDFSETIFPQDVRNCVKCHGDNPLWKEEPSRLACMACHDSESANNHATLMTVNPAPADPWNEQRVETCNVCHGAGKEFSPDKVHNIWDPYKPPYPREPAE